MTLLQVNGAMMPGYLLNEMISAYSYEPETMYLVYYNGSHLLVKVIE